MDAVRELLHLGGYGMYVWPAFAVAALALLWMAVSTIRRLRENERMLQRLQEIRRRIADTEQGDVRGTAAGSGDVPNAADAVANGTGPSGRPGPDAGSGEGERR